MRIADVPKKNSIFSAREFLRDGDHEAVSRMQARIIKVHSVLLHVTVRVVGESNAI